MDLEKLQNELNSIAAKDNGVSGVYVMDTTRGDYIAKSNIAGADGGVHWPEIEHVLGSLLDIREKLSESENSNIGEATTMSFDFEKGGLIVTGTGGSDPAMIVFVNLNIKKMGPANRTATIETKNIAKLLQ